VTTLGRANPRNISLFTFVLFSFIEGQIRLTWGGIYCSLHFFVRAGLRMTSFEKDFGEKKFETDFSYSRSRSR